MKSVKLVKNGLHSLRKGVKMCIKNSGWLFVTVIIDDLVNLINKKQTVNDFTTYLSIATNFKNCSVSNCVRSFKLLEFLLMLTAKHTQISKNQ